MIPEAEVLHHFINGKRTDAGDTVLKEIANPANGGILYRAVSGGERTAQLALEAARQTFDNTDWSQNTEARAFLLGQIAADLEQNAESYALMECRNCGKVLSEAAYDTAEAARCFRYYEKLCREMRDNKKPVSVNSYIEYVPIGVCVLIVPWNFPVLIAAWKMAAAIAAGNTVVMKPSQTTPITASMLFDVVERNAVAPGAVNLVLGSGAGPGQTLIESPLADMVSFTGGAEGGRKVIEGSKNNFKKLSLELGGKSPVIILDDCDTKTAAGNALYAAFYFQGQVCSAGSRLLVQQGIYDDFMLELKHQAERIRIGSPEDERSHIGPLLNDEQGERVMAYIQTGLNEGARLVYGGERLQGGMYDQGFYMRPAIFETSHQNMRIVREEIFGPVLVVLPFNSDEEAVAIANNSMYGLGAGIFGTSRQRLFAVARNIHSGNVWINSYNSTFVNGLWGGCKQSGYGRELGMAGFEEFTYTRQITFDEYPGKPVWA
jgi:betaine-aldehyde dehydrogenase